MTDIAATLAGRQATHGDFKVQARKEYQLRELMERGHTWSSLTAVQQAALHSIAIKLARILCGDPNHPDHWHDIAGYATLVEQDLTNRRDPT